MKAYINFRKKNSRPIRHEFCKILMDIGKPKKKGTLLGHGYKSSKSNPSMESRSCNMDKSIPNRLDKILFKPKYS